MDERTKLLVERIDERTEMMMRTLVRGEKKFDQHDQRIRKVETLTKWIIGVGTGAVGVVTFLAKIF
jgi:hypothetical protein